MKKSLRKTIAIGISMLLALEMAGLHAFAVEQENMTISEDVIAEEPVSDTDSDTEPAADENGLLLEEAEPEPEPSIEVSGNEDKGETADKSWRFKRPEGVFTCSEGYLKGIDVSAYQGAINWSKIDQAIKNGSLDFVILRCAGSPKKNGRAVNDSRWNENVRACEKYNIPYGVYFRSFASSASGAQADAKQALQLLDGHHPTLPVYYDLEGDDILKPLSKLRKAKKKARITENARLFCTAIANSGYKTGIYANKNWFTNYIDGTALKNYGFDLWLAQWPTENRKYTSYHYGSKYSIWQVCSYGNYDGYAQIPGISGRVDLNLMVCKYSSMKAFMDNKAFPKTLSIRDFEDYTGYFCQNTKSWTGPGHGYDEAGAFSYGSSITVCREGNGYVEVKDDQERVSWVPKNAVVLPSTPKGFFTEGEGEEAKTVLRSYSGELLTNQLVRFGAYLYGSDAEGVKIVGRGAWTEYRYYIYDGAGRAYINKAKTKKNAGIYANPGSAKKGSLKKNKAFYILRTSGKWSQMANGLWIKTSYTKKIVVYPTMKPSVNTRYKTKMKKTSASYTGPSTSYIKKKTLKKNKVVTVVGTYGSWAKLTTGYWVPKSKLR